MLIEFIVNEKLGEGKDRTMAMVWLSEKRTNRHLASSIRKNACNQECIV